MTQTHQIFKVLSDETRLRILALLSQGDFCVCQLSGILDVSQPTISKNLSKMRDLDLVIDIRKDKFVFYSLNESTPLLQYILTYLIENLESNPILAKDFAKISSKDAYL